MKLGGHSDGEMKRQGYLWPQFTLSPLAPVNRHLPKWTVRWGQNGHRLQGPRQLLASCELLCKGNSPRGRL